MSCGKVKQNTLMYTFRKKRRRKTAKKEEKKKDCPTSLTERSVKVLPEKIMPAGRHFRRSNGEPPDLDGPTETGYLCGNFCF